MSMISALAWVPPGACKARPVRYEISSGELEAMRRATMDDADEDDQEEEVTIDPAGSAAGDSSGLPAALRMDEYDDGVEMNLADAESDEEPPESEDEDAELAEPVEGDDEEEDDNMDDGAATEAGMSFVEQPLTGEVYADDDMEGDVADDESDDEDHVIKSSDAVLLTATTEEDEHSTLEVHVYDQDTGTFYTHHDLALPALPLCLAWMDIAPRTVSGTANTPAPLGSYVAVGTFEPGIEIWNLDVLDPLEPSAVLGGWAPGTAAGAGAGGGKKKKKKKSSDSPECLPGSHSSAVIGLSWNSLHRQVLASAGADEVVKVWDVTTQTCSATLSHHSDKVQSVQWHGTEAAVLASAGYDQQLAVLDVRSPSTAAAAIAIALGSDPECLLWDPHDGSKVLAGTEDGAVACWDVRKAGGPPLYRFAAHGVGVSGLTISPHHRGLMATCSDDKTVRLWDASAAGTSSSSSGSSAAAMPVMIANKSMAVGRLFGVQFYPGTPFLLATGGSKGQVALWHTEDDPAVSSRFGPNGSSLHLGNSSNTAAAAAAAAAAQAAADDAVIAAIEDMAVDDTAAGSSSSKGSKKKSKKKKKSKGSSSGAAAASAADSDAAV